MKDFSYFTIFSFILISLFISCTNDNKSIIEDNYTPEELAKVKFLEDMAIANGWELDSTVSQEERNKMLLEANSDEIKDFIENFCYDNTENN